MLCCPRIEEGMVRSTLIAKTEAGSLLMLIATETCTVWGIPQAHTINGGDAGQNMSQSHCGTGLCLVLDWSRVSVELAWVQGPWDCGKYGIYHGRPCTEFQGKALYLLPCPTHQKMESASKLCCLSLGKEW